MYKKFSNKKRFTFLKGSFPENPLPFKKLNRKAFFALQQKNRTTLINRIKKVENRIVKRADLLQIFNQNREIDDVKERVGKGQQEKPLQRVLTKETYRKKGKAFFVACKQIFSLEQLFAAFYKKQSTSKKSSTLKTLLEERRKLSLIYGYLSEKQIQKYVLQAKGFGGKFDENFIKIVESRLDVALFRICFFPTVLSARQWISHKHILVNKKRVTLPGYQLSSGDVITVVGEKKKVLKEKIKEFLSKKLRIRSRHFHSSLNSFYKRVKYIFYKERDIKAVLYRIGKKPLKNNNNKRLQSLSIFSKIFRKRSLFSFLRYRNLFTKGRPLVQRVKTLRITSIKPLNLEVCYKNMVAVFLYAPQKVAVPTSVNLYTIMKGG